MPALVPPAPANVGLPSASSMRSTRPRDRQSWPGRARLEVDVARPESRGRRPAPGCCRRAAAAGRCSPTRAGRSPSSRRRRGCCRRRTPRRADDAVAALRFVQAAPRRCTSARSVQSDEQPSHGHRVAVVAALEPFAHVVAAAWWRGIASAAFPVQAQPGSSGRSPSSHVHVGDVDRRSHCSPPITMPSPQSGRHGARDQRADVAAFDLAGRRAAVAGGGVAVVAASRVPSMVPSPQRTSGQTHGMPGCTSSRRRESCSRRAAVAVGGVAVVADLAQVHVDDAVAAARRAACTASQAPGRQPVSRAQVALAAVAGGGVAVVAGFTRLYAPVAAHRRAHARRARRRAGVAGRPGRVQSRCSRRRRWCCRRRRPRRG